MEHDGKLHGGFHLKHRAVVKGSLKEDNLLDNPEEDIVIQLGTARDILEGTTKDIAVDSFPEDIVTIVDSPGEDTAKDKDSAKAKLAEDIPKVSHKVLKVAKDIRFKLVDNLGILEESDIRIILAVKYPTPLKFIKKA